MQQDPSILLNLECPGALLFHVQVTLTQIAKRTDLPYLAVRNFLSLLIQQAYLHSLHRLSDGRIFHRFLNFIA